MNDPTATDRRLQELHRRVQDEPGSRGFLQLAEEYRRQGRPEAALDVLSAGLEEHPSYLSAQVALGRCQLDLERADEAVATLESVLQQDATNMVASKLLVEAQIRRQDVVLARRRLEHYEALSPGDPEAETLRGRIQALQLADLAPEEATPPSASPPPVPPAAPGEATAATTDSGEITEEEPEEPPGETFGETFGATDLAPAPVPPSAAVAGAEIATADGRRLQVPDGSDPFPDLPFPLALGAGGGSGGTAGSDEIFALSPAEPIVDEALEVASSEVALPESTAPEVVLSESEVEPVTPPAPAAAAESGDAAVPEPPAWPRAVAASRHAAASEPSRGEGAEEDRAEEAAAGARPAPPWEPAAAEALLGEDGDEEPPATVTLGEIYLLQGHREEAERIFRRVLGEDPGNAGARAGLARLAGLAALDAAAEPSSTGAADEPAADPGDAGRRKVVVLRDYLERLRQARGRNVS